MENDPKLPNKRSYHAPIRQEQAELTRQRIMGAARALFSEKGYVATSVGEIAARAEVAVPTLYTSFGSKRQILTTIVLQLKQEYDIPARVKEFMANPDPREQLKGAARVTREFAAAAWDVIEVLRAASKSDPELATVWDQVEGARLRDQQATVQQFAEAGLLRPGLDTRRAVDFFWLLTSHDLYRLLVVERCWTDDEYEEWLRATLEATLLG